MMIIIFGLFAENTRISGAEKPKTPGLVCKIVFLSPKKKKYRKNLKNMRKNA